MPDVIRLSMYQVAAMCGCFMYESLMNPGEYHNNQTDPSVPYIDLGVGLGMWTDYPADTKTDLWIADEFFNWMANHGYQWYDGAGQLACVIADDLKIDGTYNNRIWASMWTDTVIPEFLWSNAEYPNFQSWLNDTNNTNLERLTQAWFLHWESPTSSEYYYNSWSTRRNYAFQIFDYLQEHGDDPDINSWYYEIGYVFIPFSKSLDNCVMAWKQLGSGIIPPSPTPTKKKGMPIWMMIRYRR